MAKSMRFVAPATVAVLSVALTISTARAAQLDLVSGNVGQTFVFDSSLPPSGQWSVGSNLSGSTAFDAGFTYYYQIGSNQEPAAFSWAGNPLVSDLSVGGQAHAVFGPGGTLTVTGKLFDILGGGNEVFDGLLISGSVSGFEVIEPVDAPSFLDMVQTAVFTPVSGALVDGSYGLTMTGDYNLTFTGALAQHFNGDDLADFQSDIVTIASFQWNMSPVPEPTAGLALLAGMVALAVRRRS